jgi:mRNA-degrading endonuclease RelE of RelBE toxin-antitoxin system
MNNINIEINYSKLSLKFLSRNKQIITEDKVDQLIIKAIKKIHSYSDENINLVRMVGYSDKRYRIRVGKIRIIFVLTERGTIEIVNVMEIGFRGDIYK